MVGLCKSRDPVADWASLGYQSEIDILFRLLHMRCGRNDHFHYMLNPDLFHHYRFRHHNSWPQNPQASNLEADTGQVESETFAIILLWFRLDVHGIAELVASIDGVGTELLLDTEDLV